LKTFLFISLQYILPQHFISRMVSYLADSRLPGLKNLLIKRFINHYGVDLSIAKIKDPEGYSCFNEFFCRELEDGVRPYSDDKNIVASPVDGSISQIGTIEEHSIFQAKGKSFSLQSLLGGNTALAEQFKNGHFATIYLSPKDYHRMHMPVAGTVKAMYHIPGALFSVNQSTAENVDELFARNERLAVEFSTEHGPMVMVYVGAMIVASIETPWSGLVAPREKQVQHFNYGETPQVTLEKGDECGRFRLGSTVVMLFPENTINWQEEFEANTPVQLGQDLARFVNS